MRVPRTETITCLALLVLVAFGAAVIKWRGFRASSKPSAFENVLAHSVRNLAIPRVESRKTNPAANDPVALNKGGRPF
jgi:hypothetical protein